MVEAIILGGMASLMQDAVLKLVKRVKDVKGTDAETQELKDFVDCLTKNEDLYTSSSKEVRTMLRESLDKAKMKLKEWTGEKSGFFERSSSERVQKLQALRRSVERAISIAQICLSNNTNAMVKEMYDLQKANDRDLKAKDRPLKAENRNLKAENRALKAENRDLKAKDRPLKAENRDLKAENRDLKAKDRALKAENRAHNLPLEPTRNGHQGNPSAQVPSRDHGETIKKQTSKPTIASDKDSSTGPPTHSKTTQPSSGDKGQQPSTRQQSSTSAPRGHKRPALSPQPQGISIEGLSLEDSSSAKPPKSQATIGSASRTGKLTNSDSKKRRVDNLWQELWVPIDSEKQATGIKEKFLDLEGVKEVHIDQSIQKVSVLLREGSNISKLTKALLENAQLKDKRISIPWADRPR